jgi:hypothetical protein
MGQSVASSVIFLHRAVYNSWEVTLHHDRPVKYAWWWAGNRTVLSYSYNLKGSLSSYITRVIVKL